VTIEGPGAGLLAISGRGRVRVFDVEPLASPDPGVTLSGLTIENGFSVPSISLYDHAGAGAGIYNKGTLTVSGCTITNNTIAPVGNPVNDGGGIYNTGALTLSGCTLSGNHAFFGGGIFNVGTQRLHAFRQ
jgi:hypothetical protein